MQSSPSFCFWLLCFLKAVLPAHLHADDNTLVVKIPIEEVDLRTCSGTQPYVSNEEIGKKMETGPDRIEIVRLTDPNTGKVYNFIVQGHHSASAEYLKGNFKVKATICRDPYLYGKTRNELMSWLGTWPTQVDRFTAETERSHPPSYANSRGITLLKNPAPQMPLELKAIDGLFSIRSPTDTLGSGQTVSTECIAALTAAAFSTLKNKKW